jgi:PAC2 family
LPGRPILIIGMEGWIDPGYAAATAAASMLEQIDTRALAIFDSDEYIDLRARRPRLRIEDGVRGRIYWPGPRLRVGMDRRGAGVAFLVGPEPDLRWRPFAEEVRDLAVELGVTMIVGLGAFPAATPHTRPVTITSTASDQELAARIGYMQGARERPARMIDVIGSYCQEVGIPSIGLSARVPHYVGQSPYPAGSIALLESLSLITGLSLDLSDLRAAAEATREQLDELIAQSDEQTAMVHQLERQYGAEDLNVVSERDLPSGDELAEDIERYLRGDL